MNWEMEGKERKFLFFFSGTTQVTQIDFLLPFFKFFLILPKEQNGMRRGNRRIQSVCLTGIGWNVLGMSCFCEGKKFEMHPSGSV